MSENANVIRQLIETGIGWIWFIFLAMWGGTANYISRIKKDGMKFSTVELIGEWAISGFAGLVTGFICLEYNLSLYMTFALVAIAGHAGGRTIFILESIWQKKLDGRP